MTTSKQAAANRKNALQSTGPRTDEGKAASRLNRVAHGLTGLGLIIPGESEEELVDFVDGIVVDLDPLGALEEELARDVALCSWRLRRAPRAEAGVYQHWLLEELPRRHRENRVVITPEIKRRMAKAGHPYQKPTEEDLQRWREEEEQKKHAELGQAISLDSSGPNAFLKLARYEGALSRRRDRSLAALLALQRERHGDLQRELNS